ncbi:hypothetical protein B0H11DRAFT_2041079 [Mycena galericulata]|nr:hypothetical protein B0H11DRAFT_2041079 [Mycena galericulata]
MSYVANDLGLAYIAGLLLLPLSGSSLPPRCLVLSFSAIFRAPILCIQWPMLILSAHCVLVLGRRNSPWSPLPVFEVHAQNPTQSYASIPWAPTGMITNIYPQETRSLWLFLLVSMFYLTIFCWEAKSKKLVLIEAVLQLFTDL